MRVAFRTDASLTIGTGHVMRCLTLADALREQGAECIFLSRDHDGHLHATVEARGYSVLSLGGVTAEKSSRPTHNYSDWLGVDIQQDADDSRKKLAGMDVDWLVVDHYGLGADWEKALGAVCERLLAIDDLANRDHAVDMLLDQNLGKTAADYARRVPAGCKVLTGPRYALLRPEFAALRAESLSRRHQGELQNLLITMGGVDLQDATGAVLDALSDCKLHGKLKVTIILGQNSPWRTKVMQQVNAAPFQTEVLVNVTHMAELMRDADLAIGAAGSTSWERCCLGLPTLQLVLAENQQPIATALGKAGVAHLLSLETLQADIQGCLNQLAKDPGLLVGMSKAAAEVTDGFGARRIVQHIREWSFV